MVPDIYMLLREALERRASDLHISAGIAPAFRVDGDIVITEGEILTEVQVLAMLELLLTAEQQQALAKSLDLDLSLALPDGNRCRVNVFSHGRGTAMALRLIPPVVSTLDELGCPEVVRLLVGARKGLILVTGETGSGKSTTLAAMVEHLNRTQPLHVVTIEDPIEFVHTGRRCMINQREIGRHARSFAAALRAALREDPDCILVGELRDLETMRLALTAAETGHLVLATLHTNSAPHALDRMIDVFPASEKLLARAMLAECLSGVIAQTLFKRRDGGRLAGWEIMVCVPAIRNLIREGKTAQMYTVIQTGSEYGMQTMAQHVERLSKAGLIEAAEGERSARR
ncbi:type IV pilus twitching motility protein PilT [Paraburkholderia heleia]|uniref:type IV pilus twitching motility protein PilT n=1 Tax=Paraburkholderia heleia TaxID=634127 RepID=UPI002AB71562|nr:PilT/PilU family type 4a pilus ATPase [Paraburkholderia heleia]